MRLFSIIPPINIEEIVKTTTNTLKFLAIKEVKVWFMQSNF